MDRNNWNQIIGFTLIFAIIFLWAKLNAPSEEELAQIKAEKQSTPTESAVESPATPTDTATIEIAKADSLTGTSPDTTMLVAGKREAYGPYALATLGEQTEYVLENNKIKIHFSNKGGRITRVLLKDYKRISHIPGQKEDVEGPLHLMDHAKNQFDYILPFQGKTLRSGDLFFDASQSGNKLEFTLRGDEGQLFRQTYQLADDDFELKYSITQNGIPLETIPLKLEWTNYLEKVEKNADYERYFSTVYFKPAEKDPDYCSCRSSDEEDLTNPVKWVSHSNQFFNSTLIAEQPFASGLMRTIMAEEEDPYLKVAYSSLVFPAINNNAQYNMTMFVGPNEYDRLKQYDLGVEDIIPFGWSLFGTVNRYVIRPIFTFLSSFIGNLGIVIVLLTLLVKLVLYPLTYKMLVSQAKMGVLKPKLAHLKEKFKDDTQQIQVETMKIYREFGVNPLGGCMPMVLQMPIWIALYRFFPASIEFRQEGFLWANDLSSYDAFMQLPFTIPFYGEHVSLFTLIWVITTIIYTYFNTKDMDMSINPAMKYVQYFMPVMFLFWFNNYASGLTAYMCISNIFNITQTIVTKSYIINHDKLRDKLELNKLKPKKKNSFQERLETALREQQKKQAEKAQPTSKKK
jgi:YidC/Oxa1 family membrane protein insertase